MKRLLVNSVLWRCSGTAALTAPKGAVSVPPSTNSSQGVSRCRGVLVSGLSSSARVLGGFRSPADAFLLGGDDAETNHADTPRSIQRHFENDRFAKSSGYRLASCAWVSPERAWRLKTDT